MSKSDVSSLTLCATICVEVTSAEVSDCAALTFDDVTETCTCGFVDFLGMVQDTGMQLDLYVNLKKCPKHEPGLT